MMADMGFLENFAANSEFYLSMRHATSNQSDTENVKPIILEQVKRPFMFCCSLWTVSILVFIGEILYFKWKIRRNRKSIYNFITFYN